MVWDLWHCKRKLHGSLWRLWGRYDGKITKEKDVIILNSSDETRRNHKFLCLSLRKSTFSFYKDSPVVNLKLFRRLIPKECGRLQGFPDYWCDKLEIENLTDEDLDFLREIFDKYTEIKGLKKKKTDKRILKWLKISHTDSTKYKMWGNGIGLLFAIYIYI